ncbi:DUF6779 domain-containing protein [Corynebacterium pacaense]|uniref:DUF6779 domain-containing protein n=1 Tax=Corynebacterium pacaense TaxID=1816684 RepID=UPI0009B99800|nr:DUF6779 domain-containing protein [Corynebacterium pacaense]
MSHELSHENSPAGNSPDRGQILLGVLIALALIASVIMLLADSDGAMKIALLAALWAAIIGFFLVYRSRNQIEATRQQMEAQEALYNSEREKAEAERKAEVMWLEKEHALQMRVHDNETLKEIRAQLEEMRTALSELSGREWTIEPNVLRAEARRVLELESEKLLETPVVDPVATGYVEPLPEPEKVAEPVQEERVGRRRRRDPEDEADSGGRRRRDERSGSLSVAELLASARKQGK